jgi:AAA domain
MPLQIVKGTDAIAVAHPVFMIFGQPGIGKSTLGYSAAEPLVLDFDNGSHRAANRRDTAVITSWSDVTDLRADVLAPYQSIVVDTVGRCLDVLAADIAATDPKKTRGGGELSQAGWGTLKTRFRQWLTTLRALDKDVVLLAHDREDKDGDTRIVRPDIVGGSLSEVLKLADFVGYLQMVGRDRILDFSPTDRWFGKNPAGWAPLRIPPAGQATRVLAELLDKGRAALGTISEASAAVLTQVEEWRLAIADFTTAEECNAAIPQIKRLGLLLAPQVSKILLDHAAKEGILFDKPSKRFVAAAPAGTAA